MDCARHGDAVALAPKAADTAASRCALLRPMSSKCPPTCAPLPPQFQAHCHRARCLLAAAHAAAHCSSCARCAKIAHVSMSERTNSLSPALWRMSSAALHGGEGTAAADTSGWDGRAERVAATECPARGADAGVLAAAASTPDRPKVLGVTLCSALPRSVRTCTAHRG